MLTFWSSINMPCNGFLTAVSHTRSPSDLGLSVTAWKQLLKSAWKNFDTKFKHILEALSSHRDLVERQGTLLHWQQYRIDRDIMLKKFATIEEEERNAKTASTLLWLCSTENENEFDKACEAREDSPAKGKWLLEKPAVRSWKDEDLPECPFLWIYGGPGVGKSQSA
jgi:hypothetical protein